MELKPPELVVLYQQMAEHTAPICSNKCKNKFSCCDKVHCEEAERFAREHYDIELKRTNHPDLPFMGESGCTVAPHYRPRCTMHTCSVSQIGFEPFDSAWNEKYMRLRAQIETLEKQSCPANL